MSKLLNLKPLILIILFNYFVIIFGPQVLYIVQINIERFLRPLAPRLLIGFVQTTIGLVLLLTWIFTWLKLYKYLFERVIKNKGR